MITFLDVAISAPVNNLTRHKYGSTHAARHVLSRPTIFRTKYLCTTNTHLYNAEAVPYLRNRQYCKYEFVNQSIGLKSGEETNRNLVKPLR